MKAFATAFFFSAHLLFVLLLWIQPSFTKPRTDKKPLIVNTIVQRPVAAKKHPPITHQTAKKPLPAPAPTPVVKKTTPKPTPNPATTQKKEPAIADKVLSPKKKSTHTPPPPAPRAQLSESLLKELEETLSKIEEKTHAKQTPASTRSTPALQIDLSENNDLSFAETLIFFLQDTLTLPEYGEVKIQLDLREDGSVDKLIVLSSHSRANKRYLEENLPQLKLPRPQGEPRFILTFANKV